jgi:predicted Zn-dependent protease
MTAPHRIVERALASGTAAGEYVVILDETSTTHLRWAANALTTNGSTHTRRLTVIAVLDGATGVVSGVGELDEESTTRLVRAAETAASKAPVAPDARELPDAGADLDWERPAAEASTQVFDELVAPLAVEFERARRRDTLLSGYAQQQTRTTYLASSAGSRRKHIQPTAVLDLSAAVGNTTAWAGANGADVGELADTELTTQLYRRLDWARERRSLAPGRYEVLLPPSCVADLMLHLYWAAPAIDAANGSSVFAGPDGGVRVGERLTETPLTLRSSPSEPGLECTPFTVARSGGSVNSIFDNGLPLRPTNWITDGVLSTLVHTRHSADQAGVRPTPEIDNLVLSGGQDGETLTDMIASTERGLLLTSLWYLRDVDPRTLLLTGITRDGVYLVEDGEVRCAVNNFRFNDSPVGLLDRVTGVGRTERTLPREWSDFTRTAMPALRIGGFNFSATSHP